MILLGILIGLFIGGCFSIIIMALVSVGRESREEADRADGYISQVNDVQNKDE